jgi:hypothetical protein
MLMQEREKTPVFVTMGDDTYRLHLPRLLDNFNISCILPDNRGEQFNSDEREYYIKGYSLNDSRYDIHVRETGSDLLPGKIEAWFYFNDKKIDPSPGLIKKMADNNRAFNLGHTILYINGYQY